MSKFYGQIGFVTLQDDGYGVIKEIAVEKTYIGDYVQISRRLDSTNEKVLDDIELQANISLLADTYATDHVGDIRYARIGGVCWKVKTVTIQYPRMTLSIGGVYYGESTIRTSERS